MERSAKMKYEPVKVFKAVYFKIRLYGILGISVRNLLEFLLKY